MPHSSGGGSSHSGSHHSSSSSSSRSSSSSSHNSIRRSSSYFPGSRVYVRYRNRRPQYIYSNGNPSTGMGAIASILMFMAYLFFTSLFKLFGAVDVPHKINTSDVSSTEIVINDGIDVIDNEDQLRQTLTEFRDKTGIIPAVITIDISDWKEEGYDMEQYAYNTYVYNWSDEKHWLILYSEDLNSDGQFGTWEWEGMQGDDTDSVLTSYYADRFTDNLHNMFIARGSYSTGEAIDKAFSDLSIDIMDTRIDYVTIFMSVFGISISVVVVIVSWKSQKKRVAEYEGYEEVKNPTMSENHIPIEDTCDYCDGVYVVGSVISCPHCGAAIPAHDQSGKRIDK